MSLFGIGNDKTANIIRVDHENKVEVSPEFSNVNKANHALSTHLASNCSVVIKSGMNDHDGKEVTALEKIAKSRTWGETDYSVLPTKVIDWQIPL